MLNDIQEAKVKVFLNDRMMSDTIYDILLKTYLEPYDTKDVRTLAASRLAIDLLQEAWKKLEKYKKELEVESANQTNVGL